MIIGLDLAQPLAPHIHFAAGAALHDRPFEIPDQRAFDGVHPVLEQHVGRHRVLVHRLLARVAIVAQYFHLHALYQQQQVVVIVIVVVDALHGGQARARQAAGRVLGLAHVLHLAGNFQAVVVALQHLVDRQRFHQAAPVEGDEAVGHGDDRLLERGRERYFQVHLHGAAFAFAADQDRHRELEREERPAYAALVIEAHDGAVDDKINQPLLHRRLEIELHAAQLTADGVADIGPLGEAGKQVIPVVLGVGDGDAPRLPRAAALGQQRQQVVERFGYCQQVVERLRRILGRQYQSQFFQRGLLIVLAGDLVG